MKRRPRIPDPIASPAGVRRVLDSLREFSPVPIPVTDRKVFTLLNAVRHVGRYQATDKPSGRPARFDREDLLAVDRALRTALEKDLRTRTVRFWATHGIKEIGEQEFPAKRYLGRLFESIPGDRRAILSHQRLPLPSRFPE